MIDVQHLTSYLNDHLAGAEMAIDLLASRQDRDPDPRLQPVLEDIREDRSVLEQLMAAMDLSPSPVKQASGWMVEKASRVGRGLSRAVHSEIVPLLELETLQIGIAGKRALWVSLQEVADQDAHIAGLDLDGLVARADAQIAVVQDVRRGVVREVLTA
jgi:hypothetical protein